MGLQLICKEVLIAMETTVKEETVNRREAYKIQKLQEANEIYYCECGKNYLTFSALYLHCRNKHQVKLTTKRNQFNCKVEKKEDKTIVTYFITASKIEQQEEPQEEQPEPSSQHSQESPKITQVLTLYLQQDCQPFNPFGSCKKMIMDQFISYFEQVEQLKGEEYPLQAQSLTLYFNDFVLGYLPLAHQQGLISLNALGQAENQLIQLWRWLRECKYTQSQLLHRAYPY